MVYLDHAGATLYSEAQMADVARDLMSNVYGNPRILKFGTSVHKSFSSLDSYLLPPSRKGRSYEICASQTSLTLTKFIVNSISHLCLY
jgi:hypothetical protein